MRRADAPPPGWYPDPTGGSRLRWWDGLDWTDHRRAPPVPRLGDAPVAPPTEHQPPGSALKSQARQATETLGRSRAEATEIMTEVRRVAREEMDRAVNRLSDQARSAARGLEPLISQYGDRVMRWVRNLGIIAIALFVLWMVLQTFAQTSLLGWIGDRVDNLFGGSVAIPGTLRSPPG